jgi:hypothetical protein
VCDNSVITYSKNLGFGTSKIDCLCDKEVLCFGEDSRDTCQSAYLLLTVHIHDLIGLKNRRFCPVENDRKGKNGLTQYVQYIYNNNIYKIPFCRPFKGTVARIYFRWPSSI